MVKLTNQPRFPDFKAEGAQEFKRELVRWARDVAEQVNQLAEGRINANFNSLSATPVSTVTYEVGDVVRNNSPSELGS